MLVNPGVQYCTSMYCYSNKDLVYTGSQYYSTTQYALCTLNPYYCFTRAVGRFPNYAFGGPPTTVIGGVLHRNKCLQIQAIFILCNATLPSWSDREKVIAPALNK